jgi:hypothetical protein
MAPPTVIDITKPPYSAVADGQTDCWGAFKQACDDCLGDPPNNNGINNPHTIYVPGSASPYVVSQPILADAQQLSFVGDGAYLSVIQAAGFSDVLQFGVPRTSGGRTLTSAFWVDATTILDSSVSQPKRYGLRTNGIAYAYFQGTPFDMGPQGTANWSGTRQLTIDFAFYNNSAAGWYGGDQGIRLFGVGSADGKAPSPFYCGVSNAIVRFDFAASDGVWRFVTFALPTPSLLLQRVSIQLDLTQPAVQAYVNGVQVAVSLFAYVNGVPVSVSLAPAGGASNLFLQANEYRQFQLGTRLFDAGFNPGNITDQTVFGFKLTGALLYNDAGPNPVNAAQARIDGAPLNDLRQFFTGENAFYAFVPLQDAGNAYRHIPWIGAQPNGYLGVGSGLFLHDTSLGSGETRLGNSVRDLTLKAATVPGLTGYGRALCHGPVYDFKAQDCIFWGGAHNFGALNGAVGYPLKVRDCEFDYAGDAAIYAQGNMWWGERLTIKYWGREAIRSLNSFMDLRQVFYTPDGLHDCVLKFHNSRGAILDSHVMDFEGGGPMLAHVWCEAGVNDGPTFLTLRNITFGTRAEEAHFIVLRGTDATGGGHDPATLTVENCPPRSGYFIAQPIPGVWTVKLK